MTERPDHLTDRPNHVADPLSDTLRSVRLTGGVFLDVRMNAPWAVLSSLTTEDCKPILTDPKQVICYHVVLEGECLISVDCEPVRTLHAGEIVLLPRNDLHVLSSEPGLEPVDAHSLVRPSADGGLARVDYGGSGVLTHMVCGFLGSAAAYNPLLSSLPKMLTLDLRQGTARDWIEASVRFAASELAEGRLASSSVMSRLSEVLLVEAVRQYAAERGGDVEGWLRGLSDPHIGRALALMHADLTRPWSAEGLAREVAMSRSAFVERFSVLVGVPPIRYLTAWRLEAAKLHLRESKLAVAQIAPLVGYESEEAFSRAFKREFGQPPRHWRERLH